MKAATGNPGRDPLTERRDDLYETPPVATQALLRVEPLPLRIWEPAAGRGAIVTVLRQQGHDVIASDLNDYKALQQDARIDFLLERQAPKGYECIVTNPPYKLADQFVRHAIDLVPKVCMLLRLAFLEGQSRSDLVDRTLRRVYVFRNRLPRMHRDGWTGPEATSTIAFAWFVWVRGHVGPVELTRITWGESHGDDRQTSGART